MLGTSWGLRSTASMEVYQIQAFVLSTLCTPKNQQKKVQEQKGKQK